MDEFKLKVLAADYVNHDVKRFIVEKPEGYGFIPGQATMVAINAEGWNDKFRAFTFTSVNQVPYLEFLVKIYNDRKSVTREMGRINAGAEFLIKEPFGTIRYKSPGIFIAAGTGVTPFIAIFRDLFQQQKMEGNSLILSNKAAEDIIYPQELVHMLGNNFINLFTRQGVVGFIDRHIDRRFLIEHIRDFSGSFYICGPQLFVQNVSTHLLSLGATSETLVFEQ